MLLPREQSEGLEAMFSPDIFIANGPESSRFSLAFNPAIIVAPFN
jgi:hypothetical protein